MRLPVIPFEQPAGTFLSSVMSAADLIRIARSNPRTFDAGRLESTGGVQREPSSARIREIATYSGTDDAMLAIDNIASR